MDWFLYDRDHSHERVKEKLLNISFSFEYNSVLAHGKSEKKGGGGGGGGG